jgi:hypothetical protein
MNLKQSKRGTGGQKMENEKRLIDANARIKWMEDNTANSEWMVNQYNADWICSMLETAPTVDAVEVVRCKDCKWSEDYRGQMLCNSPCGIFCSVKEDSFCSYGERKNNE